MRCVYNSACSEATTIRCVSSCKRTRSLTDTISEGIDFPSGEVDNESKGGLLMLLWLAVHAANSICGWSSEEHDQHY